MKRAQLLQIRAWEKRFERNRTREIAVMTWRPEPTDLGDDIYTAVVDHPDGAAHYGVLTALRNVAARGKPRGTLVMENGEPHTAESLSRKTRLPQSLIETVINRLLRLGELENVNRKSRVKSHLQPQEGAVNPHTDKRDQRDQIRSEENTEEKDRSDGSAASNKNRSKTPERVNGLSSQPPIERQTQNGLSPVSAIAKPQALALSVADINALKAEMTKIRGEAPTQAAVLDVLNALGSASVIGFAKHLQGVDPRYRPNGHKAVHTWAWFASAAHSFSVAETPSPVGADTCRHGKADGACPQCLPRAEFNSMLESM
jgi:hypothetical protein